ncbi:MAG: tol-pal system-associated acyl-CoA thioesterase [Candidatus Endonucleobacter bathymodioli]|uniref:Tol-pal system-associated acyl-CoA thioesterase n=1 Tax=Candidatus Endonucleibacter bathymodioli TaxID=539814 RepID=A0AA90NUT3_9GAMM|nr:tol-pal system-associated acyl-CoA thioesterase [Candidatus Endonucleobacter bathymodioli]
MFLCDSEPFSISVRVYFEDTDAGGIVFYVNYLKFMERARTELLRTLDFASGEMLAKNRIIVVADAHVKYHLPARLDDVLDVTAELDSVGRSRIIFHQQVLQEHSKKVLCTGRIVVACLNMESMKPAPLPTNIQTTMLHAVSDKPR